MANRNFLAGHWLSVLMLFAFVALTLFACSNSDSSEDSNATNSSSNITENSSSSFNYPSSEEPSSSSGEQNFEDPSSSSEYLGSSSDNGGGDVLLEVNENCTDFIDGTTGLHQGKTKSQFCDVRDGKKYFYVNIGNQTWMAENLNYEGTSGSNGAGENGTLGRCAQDKQENCATYGRLYTLNEMFCSSGECDELQWGVANPNDHSVNIACPIGWHLPSTTEVEELWTYSDNNFVPGSEASGTGRNSAATKLKSTSWGTSDNTDGLGFSGLPGGYCGGGCPSASNVSGLGDVSFWWSHGYGAPVPLAKSWKMANNSAILDDAYQSYSTSAFYVRCLKTKDPIAKTPETAPQTLACSGSGQSGQKCYYGQWKNYFTDSRDGKEYPYVEIGDQTWMAANLNYSADGSKCYNEFDANCNIYGRLYNNSTAKGACPSGWHLPSNAEWTTLTNTAGSGTSKFKAKSGWSSNGTDDYGFAALPGSYGNLKTGNQSASNQGDVIEFGTARGSFWWSSTNVAANGASIRHIGPTKSEVTSVDNDNSRLYSVRCVKDLP